MLLVVGFALLAEKDEWLNRQAMQALLLTIAYYLAELVTSWVFGGLARLFGLVNLYGAASSMSTVDSFVGDVLYLALIVFSVLAVVRVLRGKDAGLPFLSKMADGGIAAALKPKTRTAEASAQTAPPVQAAPIGAQYAPPVQPSAPIQTPPLRLRLRPCRLSDCAPLVPPRCMRIPGSAPSAAQRRNKKYG